MNELDADRELREVLAMLKAVEHKMLENESFSEIKDIFAIHLAVLQGCYDMSEALEFIRCMYKSESDNTDA